MFTDGLCGVQSEDDLYLIFSGLLNHGIDKKREDFSSEVDKQEWEDGSSIEEDNQRLLG